MIGVVIGGQNPPPEVCTNWEGWILGQRANQACKQEVQKPTSKSMTTCSDSACAEAGKEWKQITRGGFSWPWIAVATALVALPLLAHPLFQTQRQLWSVQSELGEANEQDQGRAATGRERVLASLKTELVAANKARLLLQSNLDEAKSDNAQLRRDLDAAHLRSKEREAQGQEHAAELEKARTTTEAAKAELTKREKELGEVNEQLASEREASQSQIETLNKTANEAKSKLVESERQIAALKEALELASRQVEQLTSNKDAAESKLSEKESYIKVIFDKAKETAEQANAKIGEAENAPNSAKAEVSKLQSALDQANSEIEILKAKLQLEQAQSQATSAPEPPETDSGVGQ